MDNRGQTTFEYLLLVGGVVILATFVVYMLYSGGRQSASKATNTVDYAVTELNKEVNDILEQIKSLNP